MCWSAIALVLVMLVTACGSDNDRTASKPNVQIHLVPAKAADSTSTTVKAAAPDPSSFVRSACRAFGSFDAYIRGSGEDGLDAAGEVGGMVADVNQAISVAGSSTKWGKLDQDLKALQAAAGSKSWPPGPTSARLPQVSVVGSDCSSMSG